MRKIFRLFVINTTALYLCSKVASGMVFGNQTQTLIIAGIMLAGVSFFAKPVINILLLPLNLVTFGVFSWLSSAIVLYIVTLLLKDFYINQFLFGGFNNKWLDIPAMNFSGIVAYIAFSLLFSVIYSFLHWLFK